MAILACDGHIWTLLIEDSCELGSSGVVVLLFPIAHLLANGKIQPAWVSNYVSYCIRCPVLYIPPNIQSNPREIIQRDNMGYKLFRSALHRNLSHISHSKSK